MSDIKEVKVELSDNAFKSISAFLSEQENQGKAIRIVVASMSCSGPQLGLAWDDPSDTDAILQKENIVLLADEALRNEIAEAGGVNIDSIEDANGRTGFSVRLANAGTGCSSCSAC